MNVLRSGSIQTGLPGRRGESVPMNVLRIGRIQTGLPGRREESVPMNVLRNGRIQIGLPVRREENVLMNVPKMKDGKTTASLPADHRGEISVTKKAVDHFHRTKKQPEERMTEKTIKDHKTGEYFSNKNISRCLLRRTMMSGCGGYQTGFFGC
jgi:hypothetical protein